MVWKYRYLKRDGKKNGIPYFRVKDRAEHKNDIECEFDKLNYYPERKEFKITLINKGENKHEIVFSEDDAELVTLGCSKLIEAEKPRHSDKN